MIKNSELRIPRASILALCFCSSKAFVNHYFKFMFVSNDLALENLEVKRLALAKIKIRSVVIGPTTLLLV